MVRNRLSARYALAWCLMAGAPAQARGPAQEAYPSGHGHLFAACFAPGTSVERVSEATQAAVTASVATSLRPPPPYRYQFSDNYRWSSTATDGGGLAQGDPTTLTWSIVPDGTSVYAYNEAETGGYEKTAGSTLKAFLNGIYGSEAVWLPIFQQVFERWSELSGVAYVYEPNDDGAAMEQYWRPGGQLGVRGDVRIAGHPIDGNSGILAYNFYPGGGGDMVIDTPDSFYQNTGNNSLRLRNVLAHEHGHGLGLEHSCPVNQTKLMEPFLTTAFDGPQHDDTLAVNRGYGDLFEHNEAVAGATVLGPVASFGVTDLSIDDNGDLDLFRFRVGDAASLDATLTPVGWSYLSGPQNSNGSCSSGTPFDSLTVQDLRLEVLGQDGSTVLASADFNPAGVAEGVSGLALGGGAGEYFLRVDAGDTVNAAQLYSLEMAVSTAPIGCNGTDVDIDGTDYWPPDEVTCVGGNQISVGPSVFVHAGAKLNLVAPSIALGPGVIVQQGAQLSAAAPLNLPLLP